MACRTIDGSQGEGGGQILRTTLALASLIGQEVELVNIRANRPKPGLRPQHLAAVQALAAITKARVDGDFLGSSRLHFTPNTIQGGDYHFAISTAGSVTLLASAILPALLFADQPSTVVLHGGTHVPWSPVFHYFSEVFLPSLQRLGAEATAELHRWGWYPEGGGEMHLRITPGDRLKGWHWPKRADLQRLDLFVAVNSLPEHIAQREEERLRHRLQRYGHLLASQAERPRSPGCGNLIYLCADYGETVAGFSRLGRRGWPAEAVAEAVAADFLAFNKTAANVDRHLADQLALYLALAQGSSGLITEEVTSHLHTNLTVIEQLLPVHFFLDETSGRLEVTGSGFSRDQVNRP